MTVLRKLDLICVNTFSKGDERGWRKEIVEEKEKLEEEEEVGEGDLRKA